MLLLLYTFAAIANIVAKSHNFNIDNDVNPYLRVKRANDHFSDVPVNYNDGSREWNPEFQPDLISDVNVNDSIDPSNDEAVELNDDITTVISAEEESLDYENGGRFVITPSRRVNLYPNKRPEKIPPTINKGKNKTQAYYPLSHTYIPGYNQPDDVFNFEKGPVQADVKNKTVAAKDNKRNKERTGNESETDDAATEDGDVKRKRVQRSYYLPVQRRPGKPQEYYPLSHTYIPGQNEQDDVFDFELGTVIPYANKTGNGHNSTNGTEGNLSNKNDKPGGPKHTMHKNNVTTKKPPTSTEADSGFWGGWFGGGKTTTNRPNVIKHQTSPKPTKHKELDESLDYENGGGYVSYTSPKNRHPSLQQQRSYYQPIYENEGNGRKKIAGYYPLSHTYIPGTNQQEDVWKYEGGPVYPYPSGQEAHATPNKNRGHKVVYVETEEQATTVHHSKNKGKGDKDEGLLTKYLVNPIKKLFGYRKKRSIDNANRDAIVVRKRNGVTEFLNNMVQKVYNYTLHDQVVVIDEKNVLSNRGNSVSDAYGQYKYDNGQYHSGYNVPDYNGGAYPNNYQNNAYPSYQNRYPDNQNGYTNNRYGYTNNQYGYQDPYNRNGYQSNANEINSVAITESPYNNQYSLSQDATNAEAEKGTNDVSDDDLNGENETNESGAQKIVKETCFLCSSMGCPKDHRRRGFVCVRIR
ncbi:unnamed protein product [Leptosia nina]|uniref:Serine/threonine-protein kinase clkA n=1 Tax=Leptosia nina TaxID=320188 RepID=A0AAV1K4C6_9NEOP